MSKKYKNTCRHCGQEYKGLGKIYCSRKCYLSDPHALIKKKGRIFSIEQRMKISRSKIGRIPWNKGITWDKKIREKISKATKGRIPWNKGIPRTDECRAKIKKNHADVSGDKNPRYGKGYVIEKEKNPNWRGGIGYLPYTCEFNKYLKETIRKRDNHVCQGCGHHQKEFGYTLQVHHIDYNKKNNNENNLISLCRRCHTKTNYNRGYWSDYYRGKSCIA